MKNQTCKLMFIIALVFLSNLTFSQISSSKVGIFQIKDRKVSPKYDFLNKDLVCPGNSIVGQMPLNPQGAYTSNTYADYIAAQSFTGITQPIGGITVWGLRMVHDENQGWIDCNTDPFTFEVKFYNDNSGEPGNVIETRTAIVTADNTGELLWSTYPIFHYTINFTEPVELSAGWFSIANTQADCWFCMLNTSVGNGNAKQHSLGQWNNLTLPFAYCMLPGSLPGSPTTSKNFVVTPNASGALNAVVEWNNPDSTLSGTTLTDLDSVVLYIDNVAYYTNTSPSIGGFESVTVTVPANGNYRFKVRPYNNYGAGSSTSDTVYVGEDVPAAPVNFVATLTNSTVALTWNAPTTGLNNGYFSGAGITYDILRNETLVSDNQTTLTFSENLTDSNKYVYRVIASNAIGEGGSATSTILYGYIFFEDFPASRMPIGWVASGDFSSNWDISISNYAGDTPNEIIFDFSQDSPGTSYLSSPVFSTSGCSSVEIAFEQMVSHYDGVYNLGIATTCNGGVIWNSVWTITPTSSINAETVEIPVSNSDVGSSNFQVALVFNGDPNAINQWYVDNIRVSKTGSIGIDEIGPIDVSLYPNPAKEKLNITSTVKMVNIKVMNLLGEPVYVTDINDNNLAIDTDNFTQGLYVIMITSEKGQTIRKFVVNK